MICFLVPLYVSPCEDIQHFSSVRNHSAAAGSGQPSLCWALEPTEGNMDEICTNETAETAIPLPYTITLVFTDRWNTALCLSLSLSKEARDK